MKNQSPVSGIDIVINWHMIEPCNFSCKYCFAHWNEQISLSRTLDMAKPLFEQIAGLAGRVVETATGPLQVRSVRLNFAGGEPFLVKPIGKMVEIAAALGLVPSFISNGSLISDDFIAQHAAQISMAGISFDAANPEVMRSIGRADKNGRTLDIDRLAALSGAFRAVNPNIQIKINTVVCSWNHQEDLRHAIDRIRPDRWKVLRVLPGNGGEPISDEAFEGFVKRHEGTPSMVVEDNLDMKGSYLMIDPLGRFFQNTPATGYIWSDPIPEVGIDAALRAIPFHIDRFTGRYLLHPG